MLARLLHARQRVPAPRFSRPLLVCWYSAASNAPNDQPAWSYREKIELYDRVNRQKESGLMSWAILSDIYNTPSDSLRAIYDQAAVEIKHKAQANEKVNNSAHQNYNAETGRVNWEQVTLDTGVPILKCLEVFSYEKTGIEPRRLPAESDWLASDLDDMKQYINLYYPDKQSIKWAYVARYLNVDPGDCEDAYSRENPHDWTDDELQKVEKYREAGIAYNEIMWIMGIQSNFKAYSAAYRTYLSKKNGAAASRASFIPKERDLIRTIYNQNPADRYDDPGLVSIVATRFPDKPRESIERALCEIHDKYAGISLPFNTLIKLFGLVEVYGCDWPRIGQIINRHPDTVKANWARSKPRFYNSAEEWTKEELRVFENCIKGGVENESISSILPTKLRIQHHARMKRINRKVLQTSQGNSQESSLSPRELNDKIWCRETTKIIKRADNKHKTRSKSKPKFNLQ